MTNTASANCRSLTITAAVQSSVMHVNPDIR